MKQKPIITWAEDHLLAMQILRLLKDNDDIKAQIIAIVVEDMAKNGAVRQAVSEHS